MKVIVGMSGGVDSSVAAILLKEAGYEVIGVTYKTLDDFDASDAIKIATQIGIEHHVIDITSEFNKDIIDQFVLECAKGITPNPCVLCNKKIKFKYLYDALLKYNADYIVTGHYAQNIDGKIYKGSDKLKDQSYFLCEVDQKILEKVIFPLEKFTKDEVREIALKYSLITATKKDSYDVCFIKNTFKEFIKEKVKMSSGNIINIRTNKIVGKHIGLMYYTVGQRKGLELGGNENRNYVVGKNMLENVLYVSDYEDDLISDEALIENVNWLDKALDKCYAKFRYHQIDNEVELSYLDDGNVIVKYPQGIKSVTPGQTCAFYFNDELLGGGTIKEVRKNHKKLWYL